MAVIELNLLNSQMNSPKSIQMGEHFQDEHNLQKFSPKWESQSALPFGRKSPKLSVRPYWLLLLLSWIHAFKMIYNLYHAFVHACMHAGHGPGTCAGAGWLANLVTSLRLRLRRGYSIAAYHYQQPAARPPSLSSPRPPPRSGPARGRAGCSRWAAVGWAAQCSHCIRHCV